MKLKQLLIVPFLALLVSCSTPTELLTSAIKPDTGITAQVGAENTKQGVGVSSKVDNSKETKSEQRDISGSAKVDNSQQTKGITIKDAEKAEVITPHNSQSTGSITAEKVVVQNGSVWPVVAFASITLVIVLVFVLILLKRRRGASTRIEEVSDGK